MLNLEKLIKRMEADPELQKLGKIDDDVIDLLKKMRNNEINVEQAEELYIEKKQNYKR